MKRFIVFISRIIDEFTLKRISLYSAETTLFLLISSVPFLILLLSAAQFVVPFSEADIRSAVALIVPEAFLPMVYEILSQVFTVPSVSVISVTTVTALWSASKGFTSIFRGLNAIYSRTPTPYITQRIYSFIYTFLFIAAIILTLVIITLGNTIMTLITRYLPALEPTISLIGEMRGWTLFFVLTLLFAGAYKVLPVEKPRFLAQFPGAALASAAWLLFSYGFGVYITGYSNYDTIYGSLATIVLFVLWLYFCINIFMVGALINQVNNSQRTEL